MPRGQFGARELTIGENPLAQSQPFKAPVAAAGAGPAEGASLSPEATPVIVDQEFVSLQPLVLRTCLALKAMASSLEATETAFQLLETLESKAEQHEQLVHSTQETLAHVIGLFQRVGPPLLRRAQALRIRLRLHGCSTGSSAALALRTLHADLDGLADFKPDRPARVVAKWAPHVRRARSNTLVMLSEFDRHARQIDAMLDNNFGR